MCQLVRYWVQSRRDADIRFRPTLDAIRNQIRASIKKCDLRLKPHASREERVSAFLRIILTAAAILVAAAGAAHAQSNPVYVVTYVDVMPNVTNSGAALLQHYRDASRKEDSNLRAIVLQEIARPNRFAIVEIWKDRAASDAHDKASSIAELIEKLKSIGNAPFDRRISNGLYVEPRNSQTQGDAVYVLTHVDVVPPSKDDCMTLLKAMSVDTPKDSGNVSYSILQQANRPNHFTVFEVWANRKGLDAHAIAAHTRAFREKISPMAGALYDERFYKTLG
jgi:quinol monooxygenase YgiN